jgi:putative ABC transport system permease protein
LRATRIAPASAMRAGGRGLTAGRDRFSLRRGLVVVQVALSMVLLFGALLFVRSLQKLLLVDTGFRPEGVVAVNLDFSRAKFAKERRALLHRDLLERLRSTPGVISAAEVNIVPVSGSGWNESTYPQANPGLKKNCEYNRVSRGYFQTMGTPILAGRDFDQNDTVSSPKVAIVNEAFAKRFFDGGNPVGRVFRVQGPAGKPDPQYQVVALVRNAKYYEIREDFIPVAFLPASQDEAPGPDATFVIRTSAALGGLTGNIKSMASTIHPEIGLQFTILSTQLRESLMRDRLMATLAGSFGLLAGLLAMLGLYGVIAYMVARRRNEIGVRVALGADRGRVIRLVLREAVVLLVAGLVIGGGLALWAGRAAGTLLFGLKPYDPVTLTVAAILLSATALLASYAPAHRAARVEPMQALREE